MCIGIEVKGEVTCGRSLAWRAAKLAARRVLNTGLNNKKKPQIDLVKGVCRVRTFIPGCNIVVDWAR